MFEEGHADGIPQYNDSTYDPFASYDSTEDTFSPDWEPQTAQQRQAHQVTGVQENLSIKGIPELGHLDETPYEHGHVDFESRFHEYDQVPHHEIGHDAHGIQQILMEPIMPLDDDQYLHSNPEITYDELIWGLQHGEQDHIDHHALHRGEEVVHHEDHPYFEAPQYFEHVYEGYPLPLFQPHHAEQEYLMDHGDDHPTPHHYEHDREAAYHRGDTEAYFDEQQEQHSYYHNDDEGYNHDVEMN